MTTAGSASVLPIGAAAAPAGEVLPAGTGDSPAFADVMAEALAEPAAGNQPTFNVVLVSTAPVADQFSSPAGAPRLEPMEPFAPEQYGIPPANPVGVPAPDQGNTPPCLRFAAVTQSTPPQPRQLRPVAPAAVEGEPQPATPAQAALGRPTRAPETAQQRPSAESPPSRLERARPAEAKATRSTDDSVSFVQAGLATTSIPAPLEPSLPPSANRTTEPRQEHTPEPSPAAVPAEIATAALPLPNGTGPTTVPSARIATEARQPTVKPAAPSSTALPPSERRLASDPSMAVDEPHVSSPPLPATGAPPAGAIPKLTTSVVRPGDREAVRHNDDRLPPAPWNADDSPPRLVNFSARPELSASPAPKEYLSPIPPARRPEAEPGAARPLAQSADAAILPVPVQPRRFDWARSVGPPPVDGASLEPISRWPSVPSPALMTRRTAAPAPMVLDAMTASMPELTKPSQTVSDMAQRMAMLWSEIPTVLAKSLGPPIAESAGPVVRPAAESDFITARPATSVGEPSLRQESLENSTGEAGQAKSPPFRPPAGLAAEAGNLTNPPSVAAAAAQPSPVRRVHSAAEVRHATPGQNDALARLVEVPSFLAGTSTAEQGNGMKQATEPKQFAGLAQQNLPEPGVAGQAMAPELARRGGVRWPPAVMVTDGRLEGAAQLSLFLSPDKPGLRAAEEPIAQPATMAPGSLSPMESLQSSVLKHITELRHAGAIEMAVVLKPDAETQLSLRLSLGSQGEVTVQARCEQGDAPALAAHWGEIRHSLAQQGVRLGALEFSPGSGHDTFHPHASNGGPSPDGQPFPQRHGQPWPETLDDLPLTGSLTEPLGRRGVQRPSAGRTRLLESWA